MRVALVCPYDIGRFGGVQNQVILIGQTLARRGHEPLIAAPGALASAAAGPAPQVPAVSLGSSRNWAVNDSRAPIKLSPVLIPKLRAAVADADVVHVHEPLMPLVSLAARWTGRPLVGTFHADPSRIVRALYRFTPLHWHMRGYRSLAAVSEVAQAAVAHFGDVAVIPNGVATSNLPARDRVPGRIVFVGRDDPRKGLDVALDAVGQVRSMHPEAHLVVVTPDEVAPRRGVTVYRGVDDATKAELLASAEIYVGPNRRGESFGLTIAEAMAAGAACVVSDIPAFAAVAADAAVLVTPGSANDLAAAVMALLVDPGRRRALGQLGRQRAAEFSIERTVDRYVAMYEAAVGR